MIIEIDDTKKVADLQDKFSLCFPSLKIKVCSKKHRWEGICPDNQFLDENTGIATIRTVHEPGTIEIKSWSKVGEVEKEFYQKFGISIQICYRCGERWIQTGKSDNLTIDDIQKRSFVYPVRELL
jgi:hypothetical protein